MLTDDNLLFEEPHPMGQGVQRLYRFPTGYGLSVINASILHSYSFAWEVAVLKNVSLDGHVFELDYSTGLTSDVEVFDTDQETNHFISKAEALLSVGVIEWADRSRHKTRVKHGTD